MSVKEIADELIALCREGKNREAMERFYSEDIVSTEAMGPKPVSKGLESIYKKSEMFADRMEVHSATVNGPFINGDQFVVEFDYDATEKASGNRQRLHEIGVYTVSNGKIIEEIFYFAA